MALPRIPSSHAVVPDADPTRRGRAPLDVTGICPFLFAAGGRWRSARPTREHRCAAVATPLPVGTDKQLELCLVDRHVHCPRFVAARTQSEAMGSGAARAAWGFSATVPVLLEGPRLHVELPRTVRGRPVGQVLLGLLMVLAFVAVVLARGAAPT